VSPASETRAVDVAVAALRAKIERDPAAPAIVVSVKGAGYRWG
jgi:two-component system response regulator MtrA